MYLSLPFSSSLSVTTCRQGPGHRPQRTIICRAGKKLRWQIMRRVAVWKLLPFSVVGADLGCILRWRNWSRMHNLYCVFVFAIFIVFVSYILKITAILRWRSWSRFCTKKCRESDQLDISVWERQPLKLRSVTINEANYGNQSFNLVKPWYGVHGHLCEAFVLLLLCVAFKFFPSDSCAASKNAGGQICLTTAPTMGRKKALFLLSQPL